MAEIEQRALINTLNRIQTSLNKRYEKDAEMYISRQDEQTIKSHMLNHEFDAIEDMINAGVFSVAIVSRVVLKNLWLVSSLNSKDNKVINSLIEGVDISTLRTIKESIDNDEIEMSPSLKGKIIETYYKKSSQEECLDYLSNTKRVDNGVLRICFKTVVSEESNQYQRISYVKTYLDKYPNLGDDPELIVSIYKNLPEEEKGAFEEFIVALVSDYIDHSTDLPICVEKALFSLPDSLEKVIEIFKDNNSSYFRLDKEKTKVSCYMLRNYLKTRKDPDEIERVVKALVKLYHEQNTDMKTTIMKTVFEYKGYRTENVQKGLNRILKSEGIDVSEDEEELASTIESASDLDDAISEYGRNHYTGPKWYGWAYYNYLRETARRQGSQLFIDFMKEYADPYDDYCEEHYPVLFAKFAEKASKERDKEISNVLLEILDFIYTLRKEELEEDNKDLILQIGEAMVDALVLQNSKIGGRNNSYYKYLYDFRREDCLKIFDI